VLIWMSGEDKLRTWVNQQWLKFVGRTMAQELGNGWTENVHPEDFDRCLRTYTASFDAREPFSMEYRLRRHDGESRWVLDNGVPRFDPHQNFAGYIGSCIDVSSLKLLEEQKAIAERKLRQREQELAVLFDASPDAVIRFDSNIRATHTNAAFEKVTGISQEKVLGKTGRELPIPIETVELVDPMIRRVFDTGQPSTAEISYPTPRGVRDFDVRYIPEFAADKTVSAVFSIARDITERKQAERALQQHEKELESLFDNSPDTIVRLDRNLRALYRNSAWERATGITREQGLGKASRELGFAPSLIDLQERATRRVFKTKRPVTVVASFTSPSGLVEHEVRHIPEFAADGTITSILLIGRDITEQRRLQKLAEANARDIRELSARLITAQEQERRRVARDIHDSVCQQLGLLASEIGGVAAELPAHSPAIQHLRAVQAHALRAASEAHDLAYQLHPAILDDLGLEAALQNLCEEFSEREDIDVRFSVRAGSSAIPPEAASCVYRVAQEALNNIAKHAHATQVSVRLAAGRSVRFAMRDDGVGFDTAAIQDVGGGVAGLGMASMKERARTAGGTLSVKARPGHGVTIELEIPSSRSVS